MPHPQIKFGTDGWRGLIADDFTFANVRIAAAAVAAYVLAKEDPAKGLCIGYDTRFGSRAFARACAGVVAAAGIPVLLANDITPTPALSYGVRQRGCAGGIMITSSHNPAQWNGVKYKAWYGGSGKPSIIAEIESYLGQPVARSANPALIEEVDFLPSYLKAIESFADLGLIAGSGKKFCIDSMYGAGRTIISSIFTRIGVDHVQIRGYVDPLFPGINPEPIEPHIRALGEAVVANGCDAGLWLTSDAATASAAAATAARRNRGVFKCARIAGDYTVGPAIRLSAIRPCRRDGYTAETSCSSATRNDEPQPQAATTLGLSTLKPAPCSESTKSITEPFT